MSKTDRPPTLANLKQITPDGWEFYNNTWNGEVELVASIPMCEGEFQSIHVRADTMNKAKRLMHALLLGLREMEKNNAAE